MVIPFADEAIVFKKEIHGFDFEHEAALF